jgi:hypothetical protein
MSILNRDNVLSLFLGVVIIWFGLNEVSSPEKWVYFVPEFLSEMDSINLMVQAHGILLLILGFALIFNFKRRIAAGVTALMILGIIVTLFKTAGIDATLTRDVGLFGMALSLTFRS